MWKSAIDPNKGRWPLHLLTRLILLVLLVLLILLLHVLRTSNLQRHFKYELYLSVCLFVCLLVYLFV